MTALSPEPHTLLTVYAAMVSGSPANRAACRAGFCPTPGLHDVAHDDFVDLRRASRFARLSASARATAPSCGAGRSARSPRNLPIGVRAAERMKASAWRRSPARGREGHGSHSTADRVRSRKRLSEPVLRRCGSHTMPEPLLVAEQLTKDYGPSAPSTRSRSTSRPARSSACSARTAPASRPRCACSSASCGRPPAAPDRRARLLARQRRGPPAGRLPARRAAAVREHDRPAARPLPRPTCAASGSTAEVDAPGQAARHRPRPAARPTVERHEAEGGAPARCWLPKVAADHPGRADQHPRPDHARRAARPAPRREAAAGRRCCSRRTSWPRWSRCATGWRSSAAASSSTCKPMAELRAGRSSGPGSPAPPAAGPDGTPLTATDGVVELEYHGPLPALLEWLNDQPPDGRADRAAGPRPALHADPRGRRDDLRPLPQAAPRRPPARWWPSSLLLFGFQGCGSRSRSR